MPKLPEQKARDFELLDKADFKRGALSGSKPVIIKHHLRLPIKQIVGMLVVIVLLGSVYTISKTYFPDLLKQKASQQVDATPKPFTFPLDVNNMKYPSDYLKQKFLENLQSAAKEPDKEKNYKYFEDDFVYLLGFYSSTHSYDYRVQLDKFKDYMKKNYPDKYQKNLALYEYTCLDKLCPGAIDAKKPAEVEAIIKDMQANNEINKDLKDGIIRNLDQAVLEKNKMVQANVYVGVLSSLYSEYQRSKNAGVKDIYFKLSDFIKGNYPDAVIPDRIKIVN